MRERDAFDAAVAKCVMGWRLADRRAMGWGSGPDVYITHPEGTSPDDYESPTFQGFSPSLKIEHAWLVVEKMQERGHDFSLEHNVADPRDTGEWLCHMPKGHFSRTIMEEHQDGTITEVGEGGYEVYASATADTAPLAICKAALQAVASDEERHQIRSGSKGKR